FIFALRKSDCFFLGPNRFFKLPCLGVGRGQSIEDAGVMLLRGSSRLFGEAHGTASIPESWIGRRRLQPRSTFESYQIAAGSSLLIPAEGFGLVLAHAVSKLVKFSKATLESSTALLSDLAPPLFNVRGVAGRFIAAGVAPGKNALNS